MLYLSQSSPSGVPCMFECPPATWSLFHSHKPISPQQPAKYMYNISPQQPPKYVNITSQQPAKYVNVSPQQPQKFVNSISNQHPAKFMNSISTQQPAKYVNIFKACRKYLLTEVGIYYSPILKIFILLWYSLDDRQICTESSHLKSKTLSMGS